MTIRLGWGFRCPHCLKKRSAPSRRRGLELVCAWAAPRRCLGCHTRFLAYPLGRCAASGLAMAAALAAWLMTSR